MIDYKTYPHTIMDSDLDRAPAAVGERSPVEQLLDQLEAHERSEHELLDDYSAAAASLPDRGVRFIMGLILEDESRHRRLMKAMAQDVKSSVEWLRQDSLPTISASADLKEQLLAETERFLEIERESIDQLKELKKQVKDLRAGMLTVLVASMEADTHKHIEMLRFVRKQLQSR